MSICSQDIEQKRNSDINQEPLLCYKCANSNLDLVNINAYTKCDFVLKILSGNEILTKFQGHNFATNFRKMTGKNPNIDIANVNAYTKFGQILSISSQDIQRKRNSERNSDISQRP